MPPWFRMSNAIINKNESGLVRWSEKQLNTALVYLEFAKKSFQRQLQYRIANYSGFVVNTFFFVARKPHGQKTSPFQDEIADAVWVRPEKAIQKWKQGKGKMIPPTIASLDTIARYDTWEALKADFSRPPEEHPRTVWKDF